MDKNKPRGALKKQADDLMFEFCSDIEKLNENFNLLSKSVIELLENCAKTENHTSSIAHEITELRQKKILIDERTTEINDCVTKLEQRRNTPASKGPTLAPPADRLEKLEYISSEDERWRNLLKVEVTHPAISNSSPNLEEHVKQLRCHGARLMMECMSQNRLNQTRF